MKFCKILHVSLPEDAETFVNLMSECQKEDSAQSRTHAPTINKKDLPTYRIIPDSFPGNRSGSDNITNEVLYWRLEELKSTSVYDVKKMLDLLMYDYNLCTLQYLPNFQFYPPTPMLFAQHLNNPPDHLYRNIWGVVENVEVPPSTAQTAASADPDKVLKALFQQLTTKSTGIGTC